MNKKSLMKSILDNPKVFLFISIALAFIADLASIIFIFYAGYELQYFIFPLIILVLDILFLVVSIFTNYRFKYAISQVVAYLIMIVVGVAAFTILFATNAHEIVLTLSATGLWIGVHVLSVIAVLVNAFKAGKVFEKQRLIPSVMSISLLAFMAVIFTSSILHNGFFGQGYIEEARTLSYVYDEKNDGYIVKSTLKGRGNTAVIPNEFNDKPVIGLDMNLLKDSELRAVRFEKGSDDLDFIYNSYLSINDMNSELNLYAEKDELNTIRKNLFELIDDNTALSIKYKPIILKLTNSFYPTNLANNEVFINFTYDEFSYEQVNRKVLDTWIGKKGDRFDLDIYNDISYIEHRDNNSDDELHWNYINNNKLIMIPLVNENNEEIDGSIILNNVLDVKIDFKDIYRISFEKDNDSKYEPTQEETCSYIDGEYVKYKYVFLDNVDNIIKGREGFSLEYFAPDLNTYSKISSYLSKTVNNSEKKFTPQWKLNAPTINRIFTDNSSNNYTYGDTISFDAEIEEIAPGIQFEYSWVKNNMVESNSKNYVKENVLPSEKGTFKLEVRAYSDTITSLTSESYKTINVSIAKKKIDFTWELDSDPTYNGYEKDFICTYNENQVINNDHIQFNLYGIYETDAGKYKASVVLINSSSELYQVGENEYFDYEILPKEVSVEWNLTYFTYNGSQQKPSCTIYGLVGGDSCYPTVKVENNKGVNVGTHVATVTSLSNGNYKLPSIQPSVEYTIEAKEITITNINSSIGTYKGTITPVSAKLSGVVLGDSVALKYTYKGTSYSNKNYNGSTVPSEAGVYTCEISINEVNYWCEVKTVTFEVKKRELSAPTISSKVYTGSAQSPSLSSDYKNSDNLKATNVGTYTFRVELADPNNNMWKNTTEKYVECSFTITKAQNSWTTKPSIGNWIFGSTPSTPNYGAKFGTVIVEYRVKGSSSSWTKTVPTEVGTYQVRFTVKDTTNYSGLEQIIEFNIFPKNDK